MFGISPVDFEGHVCLQPLVDYAQTKHHERSDEVDRENSIILCGEWGGGGGGEGEGGRSGKMWQNVL